MKKTLATLAAALMMLGLFGVASAQAAPKEDKAPGPNGHNDKGLCTAYFNGQKAGHDKDGDGRTDSAQPFQGLEAAAGVLEDTPAEDIADMIFEWCSTLAGLAGEGVEIGGQPNENGRWVCTADDAGTPEDSSDDTFTCNPPTAA